MPASKLDTHHDWDGKIRTYEIPESKSGALPLGDIPTAFEIILFVHFLVNLKILNAFTIATKPKKIYTKKVR